MICCVRAFSKEDNRFRKVYGMCFGTLKYQLKDDGQLSPSIMMPELEHGGKLQIILFHFYFFCNLLIIDSYLNGHNIWIFCQRFT